MGTISYATESWYLHRILNALTGSVSGEIPDAAVVALKDSDGNYLNIDAITNALTIIDTVENEINDGKHFYMEGYTTLADAGVLMVSLVTPDSDTLAHFTCSISSNGILTTEFYEGASGLSNGSEQTPINNNRNSLTTSVLTIVSGVSCSSPGTLISKKKWGGTAFKSDFGGGGDMRDKLILKKDTTYLRKFISGSADNIVSFKASWSEKG